MALRNKRARRHSRICLRLSEETDKEPYWNFQTSEINKNFKYLLYYVMLMFVIALIRLLVWMEVETLHSFILIIVWLILITIILLALRRKRNAGVYLAPFMYLYLQIMAAIYHGINDTEGNEISFERHKKLLLAEVNGIITYIGFITFFSPSVTFTTLVYIPIYIFGKTLQTALTFGLNDSEILRSMMEEQIYGLIMTTLLYYVMQTHEISRFYQ